jgi:hypothetical protein
LIFKILQVEGQVQRGQMLARLKEEREAWTKVYMNVTVFTLKQLSRKVFISNGPELKHDFSLNHEIQTSRHKTEITNRIETGLTNHHT